MYILVLLTLCHLIVLIDGSDYGALSTSLTFEPTNSLGPLCVNISIVDDTAVEDDELFIVQLDTSDSAIIIAPNTSSVVILNDDGE